MTVKIYVPCDSSGLPVAPNFPKEVKAVEWMINKAWLEFHHLPSLYAIVANLQDPSADLVVITERGLGVIELKHVPGKIIMGEDGFWYSNGEPIKSGSRQNPRIQVQDYAYALRQKLLPLILPTNFKRDPTSWNEIKYQTAVCFTHPGANYEEIQKQVEKQRPAPYRAWESEFSVLGPENFTGWVRRLRFQAEEQQGKKYNPVRLAPGTIANVINLIFNGIEWEEMVAAMPPSEPFAYLTLDDPSDKQVFSITKDKTIIGRDPDCDITIPDRFSFVSKLHCQITRTVTGIEVEDLDSSNGTFVNGNLVTKPISLPHNSRLTLGGQVVGEKICPLRFELREKTIFKIASTEHS